MRKSEVGWGWRVRQVTEKAVQRVSKCRAPQVGGAVSRMCWACSERPLAPPCSGRPLGDM